MANELAIIASNGEYLVDSRLLAKYLGYDHRTVARNISRHQTRLERKSVLRQNVAKPPKGTVGGRPEVYYLLNQRQCLILTGSLKKGEEAEDWQDAIIDAFLQARARVQELEAAQSAHGPRNRHVLTDAIRPRALENLGSVPAGYFSVMGELFKHLFNLEAMIDQTLDEGAMMEISVGSLWSTYARDALGVPDQERRTYAHRCPNGLVVQAWAYPVQYTGHFEKWLWYDYFPAHFESYHQYRLRHLVVSNTGAGQKVLPDPKSPKR